LLKLSEVKIVSKPIIGILYDFDRTLAKEDLQNYSFIPSLNMTPDQFWGATNAFAQKEGVEKILSYMYMMISQARERKIKLTKKFLFNLGKDIEYFEGVETWFKRINEYGENNGVLIEHYIVSSGTKEIIEGTSIAKEFKAIFACEFLFDEKTEEAIWPKLAINYTMKTQFFFRIAKGILKITEDNKVNERTKEKRIPYRNIIYIGDGLTDVPSMLLVKENGGKSIAVYPKGEKERVLQLIEDARVNFITTADYLPNSDLDKVVKLAIQQVAVTEALLKKELPKE
jgi:2-hydroxy-3-keto-5-methylthiopentenyl-1-phosphate phosphatase